MKTVTDISGRAAGTILLVTLTLAAYWPAVGAGYVWDDDVYVTQSAAIQSTDGLGAIWFHPSRSPQYYPLVFTSYWLEHHLWGLRAGGYHLTNIVFHAGNSLLLWQILCRLQVPGGYLAALLFALHPVHVESTAWISERKDQLSTLFSLLTVLAWLRYVRSRRLTDLAWVAGGFGAALLSKTMVVVLPVTLSLLTWWRRPAALRAAIVPLAALLATGCVLASVTVWREHLGELDVTLEPLGPTERGLIAGRALWFYLAKLAYPIPLMTIYPRWVIDAQDPWAYGWPATFAAIVGACCWQRHRVGLGPFVALSAFAITLTPALGFADFYFMRLSFVADHFQYLASAAILSLVAASLAQVGARVGATGRRVGGCVVLVLLLGLGVATWRQAAIYRDSETLWRHTLGHNPQAWIAHYNLANSLRRRGETALAVSHYRAAVALVPESAQAHVNLGIALAALGRDREAIDAYRAAIRARPAKANAHYNLATALLQAGEVDEAIAHFVTAVRLRPHYPTAHNNLGYALELSGRPSEALAHYRAAYEQDHGLADARANLDRLLTDLSRPPDRR